MKNINKIGNFVNEGSGPIWVIAIGVCLVWIQVLSFGFVWDDFPTVALNPSLQEWETLWQGFAKDFWSLHEIPERSGYWRPLTTAVYVFVAKIMGQTPLPFHACNLLLHMANAALVFLLFRRIGLRDVPLLFSALLFGIYPLHAEAVGFISALPDLLSAFFGLLSLFMISEKKKSYSGVFYFFAFVLLSVLSKESGISFFLMGVVLLFYQKASLRRLGSVIGIALLILVFYVYLHWQIVDQASARTFWGGTLLTHFATMMKTAGLAFLLSFVPYSATPTRTMVVPGEFGLVYILILILVVVGIVAFLRKARDWDSRAYLGIVGFFIFWLPYSNVIPLEGLIADRYLYMPILMTSFLLGVFLEKVLVRIADRHHVKAMYAIIAFLIGYSFLSITYARPWHSEHALWARAIQVSPKSPLAWNQYGRILLEEKSFQEAENAFEKAKEFRPEYSDVQFNLALSKFLTGRIAEARVELKNLLRKKVEHAGAWDLLATVEFETANFNEAIEYGRNAIRLSPEHWKYRYNLASGLYRAGKIDQAIHQLRIARTLVPREVQVVSLLGEIYFANGRWQEAEEVYEDLKRRLPQNKAVRERLKTIRKVIQIQND